MVSWRSFALIAGAEAALSSYFLSFDPSLIEALVVYIFLTAVIEKEAKYAWVLTDSFSKSFTLYEKLFNTNETSMFIVDPDYKV
jgi:hypothetical protein